MARGKKKADVKVSTKTPEVGQIADIEYIEGIGPEYGKLLKNVGIKTTEDLRKKSIVEMAEVADISPKLLFKWQCIADLFRVRRAAQEYSEFIFEMGIPTVKDLSEQKADDLFKRVQNFFEDAAEKRGWHGKVRKMPTQADIETWIASAKELVKKS